MFDFLDAVQAIIDMNQDRNVTIDLNNELITIEGVDCCNPIEQNERAITHIGYNIGWIM